MAQIKVLLDEYGIIHEAVKTLPDDKHKVQMLDALGELEDNQCHAIQTFPKTRLHRVKGYKKAIYRADIDKISGWRIHLQYISGKLHLKDIIDGQRHDDVIKVIKAKKNRYE
mgnify:CR=1 FL=1